MRQSLEKFFEEASPIIDSINGLRDFFEKSFNQYRYEIWSVFIEQNRSILTSDDIIRIKILEEKFNTIGEIFNPFYFVNKSKAVNDIEIIDDFNNDWSKALTGKVHFKRAEIQHYKTLTEKIAFQEINFNEFFEKYKDSTHPYICSKLALAALNGGQNDVGLLFLQRALYPVFSCSNPYWHNHFAMYGCTDALHELQHILGRRMYELMSAIGIHFYSYLSLLYMYLSRCIYMSVNNKADENNIKLTDISAVNYLSIRGDLTYHYQNEFAMIWFGVNPNIQVMADKFMAYDIGEQLGLGVIVEQCHKDALKLYRHNSLVPNETGGILEMEEETMPELIKKANLRAISFAKKTHEQLEQTDWLNQETLSKIMQGLHYSVIHG